MMLEGCQLGSVGVLMLWSRGIEDGTVRSPDNSSTFMAHPNLLLGSTISSIILGPFCWWSIYVKKNMRYKTRKEGTSQRMYIHQKHRIFHHNVLRRRRLATSSATTCTKNTSVCALTRFHPQRLPPAVLRQPLQTTPMFTVKWIRNNPGGSEFKVAFAMES